MESSLIGRWAICSLGRIGKIQDRKELPWGLSWVGIGVDGTQWASRNPVLVCSDDCATLDFLLKNVSRETTVAEGAE